MINFSVRNAAKAAPSLKQLMLETPKKNLVLEGGGAKGIAYVGVLKVLEQRGMLKQFERVAGSSAGGITAFLVALGLSAAEVESIVFNLDLKKELQDPKPVVDIVNKTARFFNSAAKLLNPAYGLARYMLRAELPVGVGDLAASVCSAVDGCFLTGEFSGAWSGKKFMALTRAILKQKTGKESMTFAELHQLRAKHPELGLKDLYLTGTEVGTNRAVVFSHENPETKDVDIIDALRVTMSFPFAFDAHEITLKGKKVKFIDGGVVNNYPMDIFDTIDAKGQRMPNPETLGCKVDDDKECQSLLFTDKSENQNDSIGNLKIVSNDKDVRQYYRYNTVQIYDLGVWTLNFQLNDLTKFALIISGQESMRAFLAAGYQSKPVHENELVVTLKQLGSDLDAKAYKEAQKALMLIQHKYPEHSEALAKIVDKILKDFATVGFTPGAKEGYEALAKQVYEMMHMRDRVVQAPSITSSLSTAFSAGYGAVSPVAPGNILLGAGSELCFNYARTKESEEKRVQARKFTCTRQLIEAIEDNIENAHYLAALDLIKTNLVTLQWHNLTQFSNLLKSLPLKGILSSTRTAYDTLNNYLEVQLMANVDVLEERLAGMSLRENAFHSAASSAISLRA